MVFCFPIVFYQYILFTIGTLFAINAGRSYARMLYDKEFLKTRDRGSTISIGFVGYILIILSIVFNVLFASMFEFFKIGFNYYVGGLNILAAIEGTVYTFIVVALSTLLFKHCYHGINKPLTLQGKLAYRTLKAKKRGEEKIEEAVATATTIPYKSIKLAKDIGSSVTEEMLREFREEEKES